jgi:hypothetical protein
VETLLDTAPAPATTAAAPDPASPRTLFAATKPVAAPALNNFYKELYKKTAEHIFF